MPTASADRNLLFGILAVQLDFINKDALIAAMNAWVIDKSKPLGNILHDQGQLPAERLQLLSALVGEHLKQHSNDPQQSIAALSSLESYTRRQLLEVADPEVHATVMQVGVARGSADPDVTRPHTADAPSGIRYRILRPHARGGLGEVFVAEDAELGRHVALKEIQARYADDTSSRSRFVLEAEVTGGLEHPGIVPVYGLGAYADGRPFYAMRFIKGDNLKVAIAKFHANGPRFDSLAFRELLGRLIDVCNAVAYAHSRGVLHRDLKPGNVMLGKYGETLVVDWGLAKLDSSRERQQSEPTAKDDPTLVPRSGGKSSATIAGAAMGTPAYMSPEQAEGRLDQLGPTADVYSLGATLYELLTGRAAFDSRYAQVHLEDVRAGRFSPPRRVNPEVPRPLEAICLKAMARKPGDRYDSALALAADLERWLADQAVSAFPEPMTVCARRWMRRHPGRVAALAATVLVGAIGLGAGLYFVNAERKQTELALQGEERQRVEAERQAEIARANEREAKDRQEETAAVLKFVEDQIFAAARPENQEGGLGYDVKLAAAVKAALPKVSEGFKDKPLIEARLRMSMGSSFLYLGKPEIAVEQFLLARELYTATLGPDHPDTLRSMNNLAMSYNDAGKLDRSLPLYEETFKLTKSKLGPDHPETLTSMSNLAGGYRAAGQFDRALPLYESTLKLRKAKLGPDHPDTLTSMNNLAVGYRTASQIDRALPLLEETINLTKSKLGPDHRDTLTSMGNLAEAYRAAGKLDRALPLLEETINLMKAKLGPDHPDTLTSMNNLAEGYRTAGQLDRALPLLEELLKQSKAKLGLDHPDTLTSMNNLAEGYRAAGQLDRALPLFDETLKLKKAKLGPDHPSTLTSMNNLAGGYYAAGQLDRALPLFEQTFELTKTKLGHAHSDTIDCMNNLAVAYRSAGQLDRALPLYKDTFRLRKAQLGPEHRDTLQSMNNLAVGYRSAGQLDAAEMLFREVASITKRKSGDTSEPYGETLAALGSILLDQKKWADAESIIRTALTIREKSQPDTWTKFDSKSQLGGSLLGQKKYAEAEPLLVAGYEGMKASEATIPPARRVRLKEAVERLVSLYEATGKADEAAKWSKRLEDMKAAVAAPKSAKSANP